MQRTTVRLSDSLMEQARREAHRRGETVTGLIEKGLRLVLAETPARPRRKVRLIVSKKRGGVLPGIDLSDSAALLDTLDTP